jgi:hypothetical protein
VIVSLCGSLEDRVIGMVFDARIVRRSVLREIMTVGGFALEEHPRRKGSEVAIIGRALLCCCDTHAHLASFLNLDREETK